MSHKSGTARDAFTFSLGGMTAIASFVPAPAVADNRLGKACPDREQRVREERDAEADRQENPYSTAA
ncbi:MAG TPA: hypothetical protein VFF18_11420 [Woeseiaceae bacterium]|nr:hypothetical protein [Woeseiaceae bacterium]